MYVYRLVLEIIMFVRDATEIEFQNIKNLFANDAYVANMIHTTKLVALDFVDGGTTNLLNYYPEDYLDNVLVAKFMVATHQGFLTLVSLDTNVEFGLQQVKFDSSQSYRKKYHVPVVKKVGEAERPIIFDIPEVKEIIEVDMSSTPTEMQADILTKLPMNKNQFETMYHTKSINTVIRKGWVQYVDDQYEITEAGVAAQSRNKIDGVDRRKAEFREFKNASMVTDANIDVSVDLKSIPTDIQRDILSKLPINLEAIVQNYHGKSINSVLRNGWMKIDGNMMVATEAGFQAKDRVHIKDPNEKRGRKPKMK